MPIRTINGDFFFMKDEKMMPIEGYIQSEDNPRLLKQEFLPCEHRIMKKCKTCPGFKKKKARPTCKFKRIIKHLNCIDCLVRPG